jgi:hypothetical protein
MRGGRGSSSGVTSVSSVSGSYLSWWSGSVCSAPLWKTTPSDKILTTTGRYQSLCLTCFRAPVL